MQTERVDIELIGGPFIEFSLRGTHAPHLNHCIAKSLESVQI